VGSRVRTAHRTLLVYKDGGDFAEGLAEREWPPATGLPLWRGGTSPARLRFGRNGAPSEIHRTGGPSSKTTPGRPQLGL
jgi:hypothetical protein